jgi:hypothetical protein
MNILFKKGHLLLVSHLTFSDECYFFLFFFFFFFFFLIQTQSGVVSEYNLRHTPLKLHLGKIFMRSLPSSVLLWDNPILITTTLDSLERLEKSLVYIGHDM